MLRTRSHHEVDCRALQRASTQQQDHDRDIGRYAAPIGEGNRDRYRYAPTQANEGQSEKAYDPAEAGRIDRGPQSTRGRPKGMKCDRSQEQKIQADTDRGSGAGIGLKEEVAQAI